MTQSAIDARGLIENNIEYDIVKMFDSVLEYINKVTESVQYTMAQSVILAPVSYKTVCCVLAYN